MSRNTAESSPSEAHTRADAHDNMAQANKPEMGAISRQSLSDNSQWKAAKGADSGVDPSVDKKALESGVLQFGSINDVINKSGSSSEAASKGLPADKTGGKPGTPEARAGTPEAKAGTPEAKAGQTADNNTPQTKGGESSTGKPADNKAATLFSKDSTDEQKLTAARDMANSGMKDVSYRDNSGTDHKARLEVEGAGNKQMVHVYGTGADGKQHTSLRGVSNADGTIQHEHDRSGNQVDYRAKGYAALGADGQAPTSDAKVARPAQPGIPVDAKIGQPAQPAATSDARPAQPAAPVDGKPAAPVDAAPAKPEAQIQKPAGAVDRSQFDAELNDPKVMAAFAGRMQSEVGNQGHEAKVAFAEEVMNRAASRDQTLMKALSGSYYPNSHPGSSHDPELKRAITEAWKGGTDTTHGATGNASGTVGFGVKGGHYDQNKNWVSPNQTANIGQERFGIEQKDIAKGWVDKYAKLKSGSTSALAKVD